MQPILEKKVGTIIPGETGKAILQLTTEGLAVIPSGLLSLLEKTIHVPFEQISRILSGNVHPEITPLCGEVGAQHGLLILRRQQEKYLAPLVFITGTDTEIWNNRIHETAPQTPVERILDSYKFTSRAVIYDLKEEAGHPKVTLKIDEAGTVFLTEAALHFCCWPAYAACTSIAWPDIGALMVPETSIKMLNEQFWDIVDDRLGETVGYLVKKGIKEIPGVAELENGFQYLKTLIELERFFLGTGTFIVKPVEGRRLEISHGGKAPDLLILSVSPLADCLKIARDCLHKEE